MVLPGDQPVPSPRERRQRNRAEMIAAILAAARRVMREQGVAALTLTEIARQVGIRVQSLYEYFPNKAALYDALFLMGVHLYREQLEQQDRAAPPRDGWVRLRAMFEHHLAFAMENPDLYQLVFERPVPGFVPSEASMEESLALLALATEGTADLVAAGYLTPGQTLEHTRDLLIALSHGITALHMANEPHLPLGAGRFGSLIPAAIALFQAAQPPAFAATMGAATTPVRDRRSRANGE